MSKSVFRISPISKISNIIDFHFNTENLLLLAREEDSIIGKNPSSSLNFTRQFILFLTDPKNLKEAYTTAKNNGVDCGGDFEFAYEGLTWINTHFNTKESFFHVPDVVFAYRIMQSVFFIYSKAYPEWSYRLGEPPIYYTNHLSTMKCDIPSIQELREGFPKDFIGKFILQHLERMNIRDSIVIIRFFYASELLQIIPIADYLKKLGNTIILDASGSNEQADFSQWITVFENNPEIFKSIDYYIPYQDYGKAVKEIQTYIQSGQLPASWAIENALYRSKDGEFLPFIKPKSTDEDELFATFIDFYHKPRKNLSHKVLRLFPYKCFWSGCHFCTINSTHLYTFNERWTQKYIDATLDFLEKNPSPVVVFMDEAIESSALICFAREVLRRKLSFLYRIRTRFDPAYTKEICEMLYESGLRFAGVGLESANEHINVMVNKGLDMSTEKMNEIVSNFSNAGIPFHNYAIVGFPAETLEEYEKTFQFLSKNIDTHASYHCNLNIFSLNKGSYMYKHPEKFGIVAGVSEQNQKENELHFGTHFNADILKKAKTFEYRKSLYRQQFLPWIEKGNNVIIYDYFWTYISRLGFYFVIKDIFIKSPFFLYRDVNKNLLSKKESDIFSAKIHISPYIQIFSDESGDYWIHNWVECSQIQIDENTIKFLSSFSPERTLWENIESSGIASDKIPWRKFLEKRFLLAHIGIQKEYLDPKIREFFI